MGHVRDCFKESDGPGRRWMKKRCAICGKPFFSAVGALSAKCTGERPGLTQSDLGTRRKGKTSYFCSMGCFSQRHEKLYGVAPYEGPLARRLG